MANPFCFPYSGGTLAPGPSPPFPTTFAPFPPPQLIASPLPPAIPGQVPPQFGVGPFPQLYVLSYPSPPVSPTGYYGPAPTSHIAIVPPEVSTRCPFCHPSSCARSKIFRFSFQWGVDYLGPPPQVPSNTQPLSEYQSTFYLI